MTHQQFLQLRVGDIIASGVDDQIYLITAWYGQHAIAVKTVEVTNASEWRLVSKAYRQPTHEEPTA